MLECVSLVLGTLPSRSLSLRVVILLTPMGFPDTSAVAMASSSSPGLVKPGAGISGFITHSCLLYSVFCHFSSISVIISKNSASSEVGA